MSLISEAELEANLPLVQPRASRMRRMLAVCVLCCVGMFVVTSLFASPAQRAAYRHAAVPFVPYREISAPVQTNGHVPTMSVKPNGKTDHC